MSMLRWAGFILMGIVTAANALEPAVKGKPAAVQKKPGASVGVESVTVGDAAKGAGAAAADGAERFKKNWKPMPGHGKWTVVSDAEVKQSEGEKGANAGNTGFTRVIEQSGTMEYAWKVQMDDAKQGCGFYVFASDPAKEERGDGYILWFGRNGTPTMNLFVMKVTGNKFPVTLATFPVEAPAKDFAELGCICDSSSGKFVLTCNGKEAGSYTDPKPIKSGKCVSLTSCITPATFKDMTIRKVK